ncbi:integral membrane protein [Aspergillus sclerotioniger CBS 115572]|uniref:Integral membrane protein n=1 Tax=Aspergillus sclerotioniger CBS 115572 TaxID=1450535 RepID=A0A317V706_9EURO|nr:integral membrane protein [Aspergillus sclerotioniger CBS 115572]PWY69041.1 integral membrane protein [Aspergillus sclerotioniger CBS 115572]
MSLDQVSDSGTSGDFEHPNQNLRRSVIIALYFAFILSTVAVALRLLARKITGSKLYLDDYLIIIALLFKYGCSIGVTILLFNGLGSHITMIPQKNLTVYFKIGWSNSFVYTCCVAFIKLSILAVYKRLFAAKSMTISVNIVGTIVILWALSVSIAGVLNCVPVHKFWDRTVPGHCVDTVSYYYGQQIPNILTDVVLLVMPLKSVWALPISKAQRLLLSGVFLVGILTLCFDIVRLVAMIQLTQAGPDITYNQVPVVVWTCMEAAVGITAACLSHIRPLFNVKLWTRLRTSSQEPEKRQLNSATSEAFSTDRTLFDPCGTQTTIYSGHEACVEAGKA